MGLVTMVRCLVGEKLWVVARYTDGTSLGNVKGLEELRSDRAPANAVLEGVLLTPGTVL